MDGCQNTNHGDNDRYNEQENENLPQSENKSPVKTRLNIVFPGFCIEIFRTFKVFLAVMLNGFKLSIAPTWIFNTELNARKRSSFYKGCFNST